MQRFFAPYLSFFNLISDKYESFFFSSLQTLSDKLERVFNFLIFPKKSVPTGVLEPCYRSKFHGKTLLPLEKKIQKSLLDSFCISLKNVFLFIYIVQS